MIASLRNLLGHALVWLALGLAFAPSPAQAQTEEARILFERGNEHLARGLRARGRARERELSEALDAYLGVLRLNARTRNVVFNLALTLAELGRDDEAFNYYSEYLRAFELSEDERSEGQRRLDALRPRVAVVHVESTPPGAEVRLDRRDLPVRGATPIELAVSPGTHQVFVTREGFVEATGSATAAVGSTARVALELAPRPVSVQVIAPSTGALTLDGRPIEPGRTLEVAPGAHVVRLEAHGVAPIERRFEVSAGDPPLVLELSAPAVAASGPRLALEVDALAEVFVDGVRVGHGERVEVPVAAGEHEVRVTAPRRNPLVHRVTLAPQQTLRLDVALGFVADETGLHVARAVLGGLAVVSVVVTAGFGVRALQASDAWNAALRERDQTGRPDYADLVELGHAVESAALATDICFAITAAVGLSALIAVFADAGSGEESTVQVGIAPTSGGGVAVVGGRL